MPSRPCVEQGGRFLTSTPPECHYEAEDSDYCEDAVSSGDLLWHIPGRLTNKIQHPNNFAGVAKSQDDNGIVAYTKFLLEQPNLPGKPERPKTPAYLKNLLV